MSDEPYKNTRFDERSLPEEAAFSAPSEGINAALTKDTVELPCRQLMQMAGRVLLGTHPHRSPFAPRPVSKLKSRQTPESEVQRVPHEKVHYILKVEYYRLYRQKNPRNMCGNG